MRERPGDFALQWPAGPDLIPVGDGRFATVVERPESVDALRAVVARCAAEGLAVYPQGGKTALDYGGTPRRPGAAVDTTALARVIDYPAADMTITVESGITLAALQAILSREGQRLTLDAPFPDRATLGGIFATNTSGPRRLGSGRPRDLILGVSFATADGKEVKGGGRVVKNVAGYDFPKLLTGSMGSLGIITQMTLKVRPKPEASALVFVPFATADEVDEAARSLHASGTRPMAFDVLNQTGMIAVHDAMACPWTLVVGFEDNTSAVTWQVDRIASELGRVVADLVVLQGHDSADGWRNLAQYPSLSRFGPVSFTANLPISATIRLFGRLDPARWALQIHAGSGVVHGHAVGEVSQAEIEKLRGEVEQLRGHMILTRCPTAWKASLNVWGTPRGDWPLMERIKHAFDPAGVMNPGRFVGTI